MWNARQFQWGGLRTTDLDTAGALIAYGNNRTSGPVEIAGGIRAKGGSGHGDFESETFIAYRTNAAGQVMPQDGITAALTNPTDGASQFLAFESRIARNGRGAPEPIVPPLKSRSGDSGKGDSAPLLADMRSGIRRLTPLEFERLQAFPLGADGKPWTMLDERTKDSPRYRALGNAVTVVVIHWIASRMGSQGDPLTLTPPKE